jgi:ribosomal protein S14
VKRNADQHRRHAAATSKAMKRIAEARRCPKCGRKSAIVREFDEVLFCVVSYCRWKDCNWSRLPPSSTTPEKP